MDFEIATLVTGLFGMALGGLCLYLSCLKERRVKRLIDELSRATAEQTELHNSAKVTLQRTQVLKDDIDAMRNAFKYDLDALNRLRTIQPVLIGDWHHGHGNIVSGTVRVAHEDFDTNPSTEFRKEFWDWVCLTMNTVIKLQRTDRFHKRAEN